MKHRNKQHSRRKGSFGKDRREGFSKDRREGFSNDRKDRFGKDRRDKFGKNRKDGFNKDRRESFSDDRRDRFTKDRHENFGEDRTDNFSNDRKNHNHRDRFKKGPRDDNRNERRPFHKHGKRRHDRDTRPKHRDNRHQDNRPHDKPQPKTEPLTRSGDGVLIWGLHPAGAAWLNPKRRITRLWVTEAGQASLANIIDEAKSEGLARPNPKRVDRHDLDNLLPAGSVHQGVVIEAAPLHEPLLHEIIESDDPPNLILVLDQVTDPHNVGAIARSAAAFGAGGIVMTERNAPGLTGVLAKSASGAIEHVPLIHIVNLARAIEELQKAGYWCVGLAEEGKNDLSQCDLTGKTALVLGAEGEGLRQLTRKKCDALARLPTGGPIGSLNVSNAAAVALYEVRRQKGKAA